LQAPTAGAYSSFVAAYSLIEVGELQLVDVRFSIRPFEVKDFQAIHHYSVDVAHGLALLFGLGT
jgi:hypothetical protein